MKRNVQKIIALALCVMSVLALCACGSAETITKKQFESKAEEMGLTVSFPPLAPAGVKEVSIVGEASGMSFVWQVEYYRLTSKEVAATSYEQNKARFEEVSGTEVSLALGDKASYEKTGEGRYMYLSRIGDTMIYVDVAEEFKTKAKAFVDAIGY